MSHLKGFLISFVLSFLAFAVIILYGGSFALTLVKEDDKVAEDETDDSLLGDDTQTLPVYTTHETFSFALVITDEIPLPDDELPDEEGENNSDVRMIGPIARETTDGETPGGNETPDVGGDGTDDSGNGQEPEVPEEPEEPQIPDYITEFDEMLSQVDKGPDKEVKFICVVSINSTVKKTLITVIPGNLVVPVGPLECSLTYASHLSQIPELGLGNLIPSLVTASTGVIVDFYGSVDIDDFVMLADELGGIPYTLDKTVKTVKKSDGKDITIPAGENKLNGEKLSALLEYDGWTGAERYKPCEILMDVSEGMLDGICAKFRPNIIAKVRDMLEYVETDFTTEDMLRVSGVFFSYEGSEKNCVAILGAYEIVNGEILLRPNYSGSVDKFKQYLN